MPIYMAQGQLKGFATMGMAASQARLLTLTARLHDVEYMAQSIQNAKLALATQQDQVYKEYLEALDQTTLTVKDNNGQLVVANFNTLCGIDAAKAGRLERYTLRDDRNRIIVEDDIARGYAKFGRSGDAYKFAMFMMSGMNPNYDDGKDKDGNSFSRYEKAELDVLKSRSTDGNLSNNIIDLLKVINESINSICEYCGMSSAGENAEESVKNVEGLFDKITEIKTFVESSKVQNEDSTKDEDLYDGARNNAKEIDNQLKIIEDSYEKLKYQMYTAYGEEIYEAAGNNASDYEDSDFWYYVNLYKQIEANGGSIVPISDYNGLEGIGNASTDSDWLKGMIQSGRITIDVATMNSKDGKISFSSTGVPSDTYLEYTTTSTMDKSFLAKAEAKYEYETKKINQKDKKFDMDLSKLETERNALTQEYDSVKKVISDNIERTFGIFS